MIEVYVYGQLKKIINPQASMAENTIVALDQNADEIIQTILRRLKIKAEKCGEVFINGIVANLGSEVPDNSRVGLFPNGMHLVCGGQHLKGQGFIQKPIKRKN